MAAAIALNSLALFRAAKLSIHGRTDLLQIDIETMKSSERLLLCPPKQGKIEPSGEVDDGQLGRLVAFDNRLDNSGCQKSKRHQLSHLSSTAVATGGALCGARVSCRCEL